MRIHVRVSEGIVALKIGAETWIIFVRREDKRSPAPPPSHQLGGYQFLLLGCFPMFPEKIAKCAHMLFHHQIRDVAAVTRKNPRLRHSRGRTVFAYHADVRDFSRAGEVVEEAQKELGPIEVLVNNAGIKRDGAFATKSRGRYETSWAELREIPSFFSWLRSVLGWI